MSFSQSCQVETDCEGGMRSDAGRSVGGLGRS